MGQISPDVFSGPYTGNGVQTAFPFTFTALTSTDIAVYVDDALVVAGYVIAIASDTAGTVTFSAPPANGSQVLLASNPDFTLASHFETQGAYTLATVNQINKRSAVRDLVLKNKADRSMVVPFGEAGIVLPPASERGGLVFGFDAFGGGAAIPLLAGPAGAPGSNTMAIGSFTSISGLTIPAGTTALRTNARAPNTRGKGGAFYRIVEAGESAPPTWGQGVFWIQSLDGAKWILNEALPTSDMFGTVGDGAKNASTGVITGTIVTAALNAFTRYLEIYLIRRGIISRGNHRVDDTILVGRGTNYTTLWLEGETGPAYGTNAAGVPGSVILTDKNDRPCFAIQGGRFSAVVNVGIEGPLTKFILDNKLGLGGSPGPVIDDRLPSAWLPGSGYHSDSRYCPGAAIAIDPYAGVKPGSVAWTASTAVTYRDTRTNGGNLYECIASGTTAGSGGPTTTAASITDGTAVWMYVQAAATQMAYPNAPYDAAAGESTTQYGRFVTDVAFYHGCTITGFSAAVAIQPSNVDSNGDYVRGPGCTFTYCIRGVTVGNAQSRGLNTDGMQWAFLHTVLCGDTHGRQIGYVAGSHHNWSGGHHIQLVSYNAGYSGPMTLYNPYFEAGWRLGNVRGSGAKFTILGGLFSTGVENKRGRPLNLLGQAYDSTTDIVAPVEIEATIAAPSVFVFMALDLTLRIQPIATERSGLTIAPYIAQCHNALAGGIVVKRVGGAVRQALKVASSFPLYETAGGTQTSSGNVSFDGETFEAPTRLTGAPWYARRLRPTFHHRTINAETQLVPLAGAGATSSSLTGRVLTLTFTGYGVHREDTNLAAGDFMIHSTGVVFFISSFDTATGVIIAKAQNGYYDDGAGTVTWPYGTPGSNGTYYCGTGRHFVPGDPYTGDFTSGNAVIANVGINQGAGACTSLLTYFAVGDLFYYDPNGVGPYALSMSEIDTGGLDAAAKTITLKAGNLAGKTGTGIRLIGKAKPVPNNLTP